MEDSGHGKKSSFHVTFSSLIPAVTAASPQLILGLMLATFKVETDSSAVLLFFSSTFILSNVSFILEIEEEKSQPFTVKMKMPPSPLHVTARKVSGQLCNFLFSLALLA